MPKLSITQSKFALLRKCTLIKHLSIIYLLGHFSRFYIQSVTKDGRIKTSGGDAWRIYVRQGPASLAPQVWDLNNGMYEVVFLVMEPGTYTAQITLDFTLCDGLREPPVDWFIRGLETIRFLRFVFLVELMYIQCLCFACSFTLTTYVPLNPRE